MERKPGKIQVSQDVDVNKFEENTNRSNEVDENIIDWNNKINDK